MRAAQRVGEHASRLRVENGALGTVVDTFGSDADLLIEFGTRGPDHCDWLGVLKAFELEFLPEAARPLDERFQKSKCNNSVVVLIFESAVS